MLRREKDKGEERLPPPEHVTAIVINPDLLLRTISEYFSPRPPEGEESSVPEVSKDILESVRELRSVIMKNQLRYLPQSTLSISSKRAFIESSKQMLMATLAILASSIEGYVANIHRGLEVLASGSTSRSEKLDATRVVYRSMISLIAAVYAFPVVIKDLSGIAELSLPFHLSSDLVKKNIGYTSTQ